MDKNGKAARPAFAFGVKEMKGQGIITEFVKDFIQRNVSVKWQ